MEKLILYMMLARSCSFSTRASAETIVFLGTDEICFKHDSGTPGNIDGGPLDLFLPLIYTSHNQND